MRLYSGLLLFVGFITMAAIPADSEVKKVALNNNSFAFDLYKEIVKGEQGNIFFSPFSISTAMAMTYAGADGSTAEEIAQAMHFGPNTPEFHTSYGNYLSTLDKNAEGNIQLRIANKLWGEQHYAFVPQFLDLNKEAYRSSLQKVDFVKGWEASRVQINDWVARKTEDRIKDLIPPGALTTDTRLVLTNAIYFKGDWLYEFKKKDTKPRKFYQTQKSYSTVDFMNYKGGFNYYENDMFKMLRLPYKGRQQSMIIVLPHKHEYFEKMEGLQNSKLLQRALYSNMPEVIVSIPKFKMTKPLGLKGHLKTLGMVHAFKDGANFSKMTPSNDLYVSDVLHKAFVEIDEKGTEAAAATAVIIATESMVPSQPKKPKEFIADRPFLFYIIDDKTQSILFMGRVMNPL
ncbi:serpin family protein [bacterium SCSIO 12643]|nr:serpin family protein [bacterium SCSIO 12643]